MQPAAPLGSLRRGRHGQNGDIGERRIVPDLPDGAPRRDIRKRKVHQNQVGQRDTGSLESFRGVGGGREVEPFVAEHNSEKSFRLARIVDEENLHHQIVAGRTDVLNRTFAPC